MTIRHTVIWKLKAEDAAEKAAIAADIIERCLALADIIPQVHNLKVLANHPDRTNSGDLILEAEFDNFEDMQTYLTHPEHVAGVDYVKALVVSGLTLDYEY
jgi:hypothetical protein